MRSLNMTPRHGGRGFTLIELMIAVAIIAILSAMAFPSFKDYLTRSRRAEAKAMLQQAAMWMERNQAATYRYDLDVAGVAVNDAKLTTLAFNKTPTSGTAMYNIAFAGGAAARASYVLKAEPQGTQATDDATCGTLAIDNTGLRGKLSGSSVAVDATSEQCWQR